MVGLPGCLLPPLRILSPPGAWGSARNQFPIWSSAFSAVETKAKSAGVGEEISQISTAGIYSGVERPEGGKNAPLHPARDLFRGLTSSFLNEQPCTGSRTNVTRPSRALQPRSPVALKVQGLVKDGFFLPEIAYIEKSFSSATVCCLTKALHMLEPQSHGAAVIAGLFYPATSFNEIYRNLISLRPLSFCQIG